MNRCKGNLRRGTGGKRVFWYLWFVVALGLIVGCQEEPTPTAVVQEIFEPTAVSVESSPPETRTLPTLYPTPTEFPTPLPTVPLPTSTPRPTATPIDFTELVVEVHYSIPGLGLDRSLRGNVSSQLELVDGATGETVAVTDVPGVMFELQQSLPELDLAELPDDCDLCVQLSYELFLAGESGEGWLEDEVLLASFENFFNAHLGPHFPPDTIAGLRRSATPYNVAHTVAILGSGEMWRWTATESQVTGLETPEPGSESGAVSLLVNDLDLESFNPEYLGPCPEGSGFERLFLVQGEVERSIEIACPELSLPLPLLPVYLLLDRLADEKTADTALEQPEPTVPLESVLYYQRQDGRQLILFADDRAQARNEAGLLVSAELAENQTIDTALALIESGNLQLGVISVVSDDSSNILIARGLDGVYEVGWNDLPPATLVQFIQELDALLDDLLENVEASEDGTPTPTLDPEATPGTETPTETPNADETPEATPTG